MKFSKILWFGLFILIIISIGLYTYSHSKYNLKTYTNSEYGYKIKYPANLDISEGSYGGIGIMDKDTTILTISIWDKEKYYSSHGEKEKGKSDIKIDGRESIINCWANGCTNNTSYLVVYDTPIQGKIFTINFTKGTLSDKIISSIIFKN